MFGHILRIDSYDNSLIFTCKFIRSFGNISTIEYLSWCTDILLSDLCLEEDNGGLGLLVILVHYFRGASDGDAGAKFTPSLCVSIRYSQVFAAEGRRGQGKGSSEGNL